MGDVLQFPHLPSPGSPEAKNNGCLCPVIDNHYGDGRHGDSEQYGWITHARCPLHEKTIKTGHSPCG